MSLEPFITYNDLQRDPYSVFGGMYFDANFTNCIHNMEEIIKKCYSLYKKECQIKISNEKQGWADYIISHFRHHGFSVELTIHKDYKILIFDLSK